MLRQTLVIILSSVAVMAVTVPLVTKLHEEGNGYMAPSTSSGGTKLTASDTSVPAAILPRPAANVASGTMATGEDPEAKASPEHVERGSPHQPPRLMDFTRESQPRPPLSEEENAVIKTVTTKYAQQNPGLYVTEKDMHTYTYDIDNDGRAEVLVYVDSPATFFCGSSGCTLQVYHRDNDQALWAPILFGQSDSVIVPPGTIRIEEPGGGLLRFCDHTGESCSCGHWRRSEDRQRYEYMSAACVGE